MAARPTYPRVQKRKRDKDGTSDTAAFVQLSAKSKKQKAKEVVPVPSIEGVVR